MHTRSGRAEACMHTRISIHLGTSWATLTNGLNERTKSVRHSQVCHVSPSCRVKSERSAHSDRAPSPFRRRNRQIVPQSGSQHEASLMLRHGHQRPTLPSQGTYPEQCTITTLTCLPTASSPTAPPPHRLTVSPPASSRTHLTGTRSPAHGRLPCGAV
jgi:hypothetical protein